MTGVGLDGADGQEWTGQEEVTATARELGQAMEIRRKGTGAEGNGLALESDVIL